MAEEKQTPKEEVKEKKPELAKQSKSDDSKDKKSDALQDDKKEESKPVEKPKEELSKVYTIPLRNTWLKVPRYKRTRKAIQEIKIYIARHMKLRPENKNDLSKVKISTWLNNDIWFRGCKKPPARIKVRAIKQENGNILVDFFEVPEVVRFAKQRHEKSHKAPEKPKNLMQQAQSSIKGEPQNSTEKTPEESKDEKEKEQSVAVAKEKVAESQAKAQKHTKQDKSKSSASQRKVISRH
jgi:large subunit ribosomal protein L31e